MSVLARAVAGCLVLLFGACASREADDAAAGELPVVQQRLQFASVAAVGEARCALLRDEAGLAAWLRELSVAVDPSAFAWGQVDVLAALTDDVDGTEVWLASEEGVDVVTFVMTVMAEPAGTMRLHLLALPRRRNQLAVVLRECEGRGERTLAVFTR